jgi:hypothetical protein
MQCCGSGTGTGSGRIQNFGRIRIRSGTEINIGSGFKSGFEQERNLDPKKSKKEHYFQAEIR